MEEQWGFIGRCDQWKANVEAGGGLDGLRAMALERS